MSSFTISNPTTPFLPELLTYHKSFHAPGFQYQDYDITKVSETSPVEAIQRISSITTMTYSFSSPDANRNKPRCQSSVPK